MESETFRFWSRCQQELCAHESVYDANDRLIVKSPRILPSLPLRAQLKARKLFPFASKFWDWRLQKRENLYMKNVFNLPSTLWSLCSAPVCLQRNDVESFCSCCWGRGPEMCSHGTGKMPVNSHIEFKIHEPVKWSVQHTLSSRTTSQVSISSLFDPFDKKSSNTISFRSTINSLLGREENSCTHLFLFELENFLLVTTSHELPCIFRCSPHPNKPLPSENKLQWGTASVRSCFYGSEPPISAWDLCRLPSLLQSISESAHFRTFGTPDCTAAEHEYLIHCLPSCCISRTRKRGCQQKHCAQMKKLHSCGTCGRVDGRWSIFVLWLFRASV